MTFAYGLGSPQDNMTARGPYSRACSTAPASIAQVRQPTPHGEPVPATIANSRSRNSRSPPPAPTSPSPPPRDTAAARAPPADPPIGARAMGRRTPNNPVNAADRVTSGIISPPRGRDQSRIDGNHGRS